MHYGINIHVNRPINFVFVFVFIQWGTGYQLPFTVYFGTSRS